MTCILKKFSRLLDKRQKKRLSMLFFMMLVGACMESLSVSLMLPLISAIMQPDIVETNRWIAAVCAFLPVQSYRDFVVLCIIALILFFIVKDLFLILQYYAQAHFVYNNQFATQCRLLHIFMQRPYEYYLNINSGEVIRLIQTDVEKTFELLTILLSFATELLVSLVLVITVFVMDPGMTVFIAVSLILIMLVIARVVKPLIRQEGQEAHQHAVLTNKWLLQAIQGIKETKVTHKEEFFETNYNKCGRRFVQAEKLHSVMWNVPRLLIEMISVCSVLVLIAIMILRGKEIETLIPTLGAFALAAVKLLPSANRIISALNDISYKEPSLDKLLEYLDIPETQMPEKPELLGNKVSKESSAQKPSGQEFKAEHQIELKGISYSYPNCDKKVLENADLVIPVGKSVGIMGSSGAGKTTAVDVMLGLLQPQKGQVLVDGVDIQENYIGWLSHIGYIPQMIFMLDDTIRTNVAFGVPEKEIDDQKLWRALEEAQLAEFVRELPQGLETVIGERGVRLSGGQRQRIGIARALYRDPEVLFFDEATSALDNETEAAIMESINGLHGRKTMVIIAHRPQTIQGCDLVYRVEDGKIRKTGNVSAETWMQSGEIYGK